MESITLYREWEKGDARINDPSFDPNLQISNVYRFYINFAIAREGVFRTYEYNRHLLRTASSPKILEQQMNWSQTALRRLVEAGWFIRVRNEEYMLNPQARDFLIELDKRRKPQFEPGKRHRAILKLHERSVVSLDTIRAATIKGSAAERERQEKMLKGMLRNLKREGYLESEKRGMYRLTAKALALLEQPKTEKTKRTRSAHPKGITLTQFDCELLKYQRYDPSSGQNVIDLPDPERAPTEELAAQYERLRKRMSTLERHNLIIQGTIRESILRRLEITHMLEARRPLTLEMLMPEQKKLLSEMRQFDALTMPQVIEFIYAGDSITATLDISFLIKHRLLYYESEQQLLLLEQRGVRFTRLLTDNEMQYKPKAHSRPSELAHDLLIYPAFKKIEKEILDTGGEIITLQSDRQLKRDHALGVGIAGGIPDLRITYRDKDGRERVHDLEADAGYDERAIASKIESFLSGGSNGGNVSGNTLSWVVNTAHQASKVAYLLRKAETDRPLRRRRKIELLVTDERGNIKKVLW